jgi:hypothetical protein
VRSARMSVVFVRRDSIQALSAFGKEKKTSVGHSYTTDLVKPVHGPFIRNSNAAPNLKNHEDTVWTFKDRILANGGLK